MPRRGKATNGKPETERWLDSLTPRPCIFALNRRRADHAWPQADPARGLQRNAERSPVTRAVCASAARMWRGSVQRAHGHHEVANAWNHDRGVCDTGPIVICSALSVAADRQLAPSPGVLLLIHIRQSPSSFQMRFRWWERFYAQESAALTFSKHDEVRSQRRLTPAGATAYRPGPVLV
jgi:hypothetical protein